MATTGVRFEIVDLSLLVSEHLEGAFYNRIPIFSQELIPKSWESLPITLVRPRFIIDGKIMREVLIS